MPCKPGAERRVHVYSRFRRVSRIRVRPTLEGRDVMVRNPQGAWVDSRSLQSVAFDVSYATGAISPHGTSRRAWEDFRLNLAPFGAVSVRCLTTLRSRALCSHPPDGAQPGISQSAGKLPYAQPQEPHRAPAGRRLAAQSTPARTPSTRAGTQPHGGTHAFECSRRAATSASFRIVGGRSVGSATEPELIPSRPLRLVTYALGRRNRDLLRFSTSTRSCS